MIHCENAEIETLVKERFLIDRQFALQEAGFLASGQKYCRSVGRLASKSTGRLLFCRKAFSLQARRPIFHKQAVVKSADRLIDSKQALI